MLVWPAVDSSMYLRVVPKVNVGVAHSLYHRIGVQEFSSFTVDFWVYAQLQGKVNFSFPGPHVSFCLCAVLFVHGVRHCFGVHFIVVIRGRLF